MALIHKTCPTLFSLVVDNFGIKAVDQCNDDHLLAALCDMYTDTVDCTEPKYLGLALKWSYDAHTCNASLSEYINTELHHFQYPKPLQSQDLPHKWTVPMYNAPVQFAEMDDTTPALDTPGITKFQQIIRTLIFYAREGRLHHVKCSGHFISSTSTRHRSHSQSLMPIT